MKLTLFILLTIFFNSLAFAQDEKIDEIFAETSKKVQDTLKSDKFNDRQKKAEIQKIVDLGKSKLNDLKSFYIQRQLFKESDKVKEAIATFANTDFKANKPIDVAKPADTKAKPAETKTTPLTSNDSSRTVTFFESIQSYDFMDQAQKEQITRRLIIDSKGANSVLSSPHFLVSGDWSAENMTKLLIRLEWMARNYKSFFQPDAKEPLKKINIYVYKNFKEAEPTLNEKNIKLGNNANDHFDFPTNTAYLFSEGIRDPNCYFYNFLAVAYNEPFADSQFYLEALRNFYSLSSIESIRKEIVFSWRMSQNREGKIVSLFSQEAEKIKEDIVSEKFAEYWSLKHFLIIYLINKGDSRNLKILMSKSNNVYFKSNEFFALLSGFKEFLNTEMPLAGDYCIRLISLLKNGYKNYDAFQENEDKMIIVDSKYSNLPMAKYYKGLHYFHSAKYDQAIKVLLELNENIERYPFIYSILAVSYLRTQNMPEALNYKAKAIKISSQDPLINRFGTEIK